MHTVSNNVWSTSLGLALLLFASTTCLRGFADPPQSDLHPGIQLDSSLPSVFLIGNSLTWDTLPGLLDGKTVAWHIDCGKNLKYIYDKPDGPCVKTSTPWPKALQHHSYDILCVQPHFGTSLDEDVRIISHWMSMQPNAALLIHTGWNRHRDLKRDFHADWDGLQMLHNQAYYQALMERLRKAYPQRQIRSTHALETLVAIAEQLDNAPDASPLHSLSDLYRDDIHMTTQAGRYLMHNLMRGALGQPRSSQGFQLNPDVRQYLDKYLDSAGERLAAATQETK